MEVTIKPTGNKVVIEQDATVMKHGSIHVAPNHTVLSMTGTVRAVGDGEYTKKGVRIPIEVKVGDRVQFTPGNVEYYGELLIMPADDIQFVMKG